MDPGDRLERAEEREQYDLHENDPADPRYRKFLSHLSVPLLERVAPGSQGLDFGCGPGPALAMMLEEAGHRMSVFDPYYDNDPRVLESKYDFLTATEVVEHFHRPGEEFRTMFSLLRPGGWLGVMTSRLSAPEGFASWHYKNDPTHVCFYADATLVWLAHRHAARVEILSDRVALFQAGYEP